MRIYTNEHCADYAAAGHPERPARVTRSAAHLRERHADWRWTAPETASPEMLLRAHSPAQLARLRDEPESFDADTPAYPQIYLRAAEASGAAVAAAQSALAGEKAFSLMRPPGHHATRDRAMGFCYTNHIAVAALDVLTRGATRVAIWDFDAHHGNGTEELVTGHAQIRFASVHQFPAYPGTGARSFENILNHPIAPLTPRKDHLHALRESLDELLRFRPDVLLVSAGFDAYAGDPITQMTLETEDFASIGRWLSEVEVPTGAILEGGYSDDLPLLIDAFLSAWTTA